MAIFNFFKQPKIRQYHHEYIYFDPEKEKREERLKRVREELSSEQSEGQGTTLRRGVFQDQRKTTSVPSARNTRLVLLVAVVALLIYFLR